MTVKLSDITSFINEIAPEHTALDWDNSGLQVGNPLQVIKAVLLALDITPAVLEEAVQMSADLVLTHHPMIFKPIKSIDYSTKTGLLIKEMISRNIALYSAHTNLDRSLMGTGASLAGLVGLKNLRRYTDNENDEMNMIITGMFEPSISKQEFIGIIKNKLNIENLRLIGNIREISTAAVIPGSGGSMIGKLNKSFDIIITGEVSYHEALNASAAGDTVALLGHFISEKPVMYHLAEELKKRFPELVTSVAMNEGEPYEII
jgi:GTP cyclohydrolase I